MTIFKDLLACQICKARFSATRTAHSPRPVWQGEASAKILIAGQAPGARVHESGRPFTDASGDRLRDWMAVSHQNFYNAAKVAILPMAFCFPGYDAKGGDLPPPKICSNTWRARVLGAFPNIEVTLLVGSYAQNWHLQDKRLLRDRVADWRAYAPDHFVLPHPSWRNTGWLKKNPWFEAEVIPALRSKVSEVLK